MTSVSIPSRPVDRLVQLKNHLSTMTQKQHKLCMIPGPVEFHEDVLEAMSTPATSHVDPNFIPVFGEVIEMTRKVVLSQAAQPIILSGSGTLGWDQMCNVIEEGDEVIVTNTGYFGDRFGECLETYGAHVTAIRVPVGHRVTVEKVKEAFESIKKPVKMITMTHVDTSTGVLGDVKGIAAYVRQHSPETLIVIDAVCAVASEELRFDEWDIDVVISATQKALGAPPGLSVVVASQRAIKVYENRKTPVRNYYSNWGKWLPIMAAYEARKPAYFATPAVQLIYAFHVSLSQILAYGIENRFAAHREASVQFRMALAHLGLKPVAVDETCAANGMTAVWYPEGVDAKLVAQMAGQGVQIAGGLLQPHAPNYFRIGHMGLSVCDPNRKHIKKVIDVLTASLSQLGYKA
ncbi:hypothetical protein BZG36_04028 [Bifiguratus adelaidae]|uniref:alanine--glyoxylate transaminase n=1 Tax=Bifiguratus adelaidae TaxID=1938954 RepID=A0A261XYS6_9FUNG|nr:hypothetical protein BZG36_04028 [Bifiguratus adelaidae]